MDNDDQLEQIKIDLDNANIDEKLRNALKGIAIQNYVIFEKIEILGRILT